MRSAALAKAWAKSLSSIRGRLVLSFILIALVAIGIVGGFSGALLKHFVERRESAYLQSNASTVAQRALELMVPMVRPLSLGDLVRTSAFISDSRIRILDREQRVLADSGPPNGSDHVWLRIVATINVGDTVVRHRVWIPVSSDPAQLAGLRRSLPVLERLGDAQAVVVRRRSGLWGSFIEFHDYEGPLLTAIAREDSVPADDTMRNTHVEPIGDPGNPVGYVEIARSPDLPGEALETIIGPFIIAALAATILAAMLGFVFGRRLTAPIEGLTASAVRMGSGDLAARAPSIGSDEIGELGRQFNAMAGKLESTVRDLRQERDVLRRFVADASHELRTPVTALKTFNELLLTGAQLDTGAEGVGPGGTAAAAAEGGSVMAHDMDTVPRRATDGTERAVSAAETDRRRAPAGGNMPPWRRPVAAAAALAAGFRKGNGRAGRGIDGQTRIEFLHDSRRQIERMEWIVENLLNLSRLEAGVTASRAIRVTLGDFVRGAERRVARAAAAAGVHLAIELAPVDGELELESAGIEIALDNVMQNAIRYGSAGDEVRIHAADERGWAVVEVRDRGPGIAPEDLPHIFNRFYRGKQVGTAETAHGSGLGLAIARAAVLANGGNITAANNHDGPGATITLHLPLRRV
jgi:signal transduction histidine kinase